MLNILVTITGYFISHRIELYTHEFIIHKEVSAIVIHVVTRYPYENISWLFELYEVSFFKDVNIFVTYND